MEPEGGSLSDCKEEGKCVRVAAEYASTGSAPDEEIDPQQWVQDAMGEGPNPRQILLPLLGPDCPQLPDMDDVTLWRLVVSLLMTPEPRNKLPQYNTLDDVVQLISGASNIMVLTGAGISVSCGIPDFRSPQGLYATLHREFPELPDPQAMFDIHYFNDDPRPFFRFCKEIYPGQFTPSPSHYFIAALEQRGKLLRHYTQNIDTLEHTAGISRVVYCHGSFATASCCRCKYRVDCDFIREDIMKQEVPLCPKCMQEEEKGEQQGEEESAGVMKPDIVFFGEGLPDEFHHALEDDKTEVDLLIVMGSSLKVRPVSLIPSVLDNSVPQVLINREPLPHMTFDIQLLGYSDTIVGELCRRLGTDWVESVGVASDQNGVLFSSPEEHTHVFTGAVWKANTVTRMGSTVDSEPNVHKFTTETNGHTLRSEPDASIVPDPCSKDYNPKLVADGGASCLTSEPCSSSRELDYHPSPPTSSTQSPPSQPVPASPSSIMPGTTHGPSQLPNENTPPTKRLRVNSGL